MGVREPLYWSVRVKDSNVNSVTNTAFGSLENHLRDY